MPRRRPAVTTPPPPGAVSPSLDVVVKPGFGQPPAELLPKGSKVLPVAPELPKSVRSPEADFLRRSYQIVLPARANVKATVQKLKSAEGIESVTVTPQLELPR